MQCYIGRKKKSSVDFPFDMKICCSQDCRGKRKGCVNPTLSQLQYSFVGHEGCDGGKEEPISISKDSLPSQIHISPLTASPMFVVFMIDQCLFEI